MDKIKQAHNFSKKNKESLEKSGNAGCFYCLKIYPVSEIKDWLPYNFKTHDFNKKGHTAICPKCHIDAVVGDSDIELTKELLKEMYEYWFNQPITFFKNGKLVEEKLMDA